MHAGPQYPHPRLGCRPMVYRGLQQELRCCCRDAIGEDRQRDLESTAVAS
jgi:hypothetical protein